MQVRQRAVLRAAARAAADVPRARQRRHGRRHPARRARAVCGPDRLSVVLVGNAAAFASQLRGVGFGTFETIELGRARSDGGEFQARQVRAPAAGGPEAGRMRAGRRSVAGLRSGYQQAPLASRPSQEPRADERAQAMALLDRVIAAKGGLEKLRALKTIVAKQTQVSQRARRRATRRDDQLHPVSRSLPRRDAGAMVQAYDGAQAWMKDRPRRPRRAASRWRARPPPACGATWSRCCSRRRTAR